MKRSMNLLPQISQSILLALSLRPRHGYEIIKQVDADSNGRIIMSPGTLYGTIDKLLQQQLIQEVKVPDEQRRKYYELTQEGHARLAQEMDYFASTVAIAKQRQVLALA